MGDTRVRGVRLVEVDKKSREETRLTEVFRTLGILGN